MISGLVAIAEFPVVVEAGGAWTSVTPGSQQYWLQAFNNVLYGRWKKMDAGYGKAVLGYFGRPPLRPDPEVVKIAAEQLEKGSYALVKGRIRTQRLEQDGTTVYKTDVVASRIVPLDRNRPTS